VLFGKAVSSHRFLSRTALRCSKRVSHFLFGFCFWGEGGGAEAEKNSAVCIAEGSSSD